MTDLDGPRPSFALAFMEPFRAFGELAAQPAGSYLLGFAPKGDGHPVLTLPGFMTSDRSTAVKRRYLRGKNFDPYPWKLGRNNGPHSSGDNGSLVDEQIDRIFDKTGRKVSLVGWSLGGAMARNAARRQPEKIRQVITLGSPFNATANSSTISALFKQVSGRDIREESFREVLEYNRPPPPASVPSTAIFTKSDGIVHWTTCIERPAPNTDNIEVYASHCGLGVNASVFYLLAERLSQPEGEWQPFDRHAQPWRRMVYPSGGHSYGV